MTNKPMPESKKYFRQIVSLIDNMERAADHGSDIGYEARMLLGLVEQYGDKRALEAKISMGYVPDNDEVPF